MSTHPSEQARIDKKVYGLGVGFLLRFEGVTPEVLNRYLSVPAHDRPRALAGVFHNLIFSAQNRYNILTIVENAKVPILVDAGVGTASDAAIAMELGCDGVLMNTAIAGAKDPVLMASAKRKAVEAGREAFLAGRIPRKRHASASSPVDGLIE